MKKSELISDYIEIKKLLAICKLFPQEISLSDENKLKVSKIADDIENKVFKKPKHKFELQILNKQIFEIYENNLKKTQNFYNENSFYENLNNTMAFYFNKYLV